MKHKIIYERYTSTPLFSGTYTSLKDCVEDAVKQRVSLKNANLKYADLHNANLDNIDLCGADISYANLSGANISESKLIRVNAQHTSLYNTCLAHSNLENIDLRLAEFGATDFSCANLNNAKFFIPDIHKVNWMNIQTHKHCLFEDIAHETLRSSNPPLCITGIERQPIIVIGDHLIIQGLITREQQNQGVKTYPLTKLPIQL